MVRRTKDEAVETRNQILDAAERVFSERGVSRTSLTDIADAASVTRGAIYWHFKDKAELFCEMVARVTMPMEHAPCQIDPASMDDPLAGLRDMLVGILERTSVDAQGRRVFHIVFHKCEYVDEMKPVWTRFSEMRAGCRSRIENGLKAAIKAGQLPKGLNVQRKAEGLHCLIDGLISNWVMDPAAIPATHEAERLIDVFIEGLRHSPVKAVSPRPAAVRRKPAATIRRKAA